MNIAIYGYLKGLTEEFDRISPERKALLSQISEYVRAKRDNKLPVNLMYICTHNSRRSHFGQIWAKVAADFYQVDDVHTFSGGTEATAFNTSAINALKRAGFRVVKTTNSENPVYHVYHNDNNPGSCFSKVYNHPDNPKAGFAAIMTCSDAEENCPFIPGAELRIGTTYEDPKAFDDTPLQGAKYDERCRQIALETLYVFSLLKK